MQSSSSSYLLSFAILCRRRLVAHTTWPGREQLRAKRLRLIQRQVRIDPGTCPPGSGLPLAPLGPFATSLLCAAAFRSGLFCLPDRCHRPTSTAASAPGTMASSALPRRRPSLSHTTAASLPYTGPTAGTQILCPHRGSARTDRDSASLTRGRCAAAPPRLRGAAPALSARRSAAARVPAALAKPPILHSRMCRLPHPDPDPESESHGHPV